MCPLPLGECLGFAPNGKLEKIHLAGFPNPLHEWEQDIDLGGKFFRPSGWDECFPTIDPYQDSPVMGELIGLSPEIHWDEDCVEQVWRSSRFEARRRFSLKTPVRLEMSFQVTNRQKTPLEFLWASHALFSVENLALVRLSKNTELTSFTADGSERKIFTANTNQIELIYPDFKILLTTDQPWWGIWLNRGGWPEKNNKPLCCLGVEATNTPGEHPDGHLLDPNTTFFGKVQLEIHSKLFS